MKKMNRIVSAALSLMLALSLLGGTAVSAEEGAGEATPTPSAVPAPSGPELISYVVKVENNRWAINQTADVTVTVKDEVADNGQVTASISCPSFSWAQSVQAAGSDGIYTFQFNGVRFQGGDNQMRLEFVYGNNSTMGQLSFPVGQCDLTPPPTPTPEPIPTPAPEPVYKTPNLIVKQSNFGGNEVEAGKEFTLNLTLFTTTGNENLTDVLVTLALPKNVALANGNLNSYVGSVGPEGTRTISFNILPSVNFVDGVASIGVSMSGVGEQSGKPVTSETSVSVPVVLPERFEVTNMEVPETMMMGDEGYLSVTYVNKGKGRISNLSAQIEGENLANPGQSQFIGNVEPGTENSVDFSVLASAEGPIKGKVVLTWEDDQGEAKTLEKEFSCTVEPMMMPDMGEMDGMGGMRIPSDADMMNGPKAGMPWWGWVLIVVGVAGAGTAVLLVLRKKKKAKALALLEEEDADL